MGLKVLVHVLKATINAELSANTGAMTHHLEVGVGLEKKTYQWRAGLASLKWQDIVLVEEYHDAFGIISFLS